MIVPSYDIGVVAQKLLPNLTKRKGGFKCKCPFHEEARASFYIYTQSGRFVCYGCGASGDAIDLVRRLHDSSFSAALDYLAANFEASEVEVESPAILSPWMVKAGLTSRQYQVLTDAGHWASKRFSDYLWMQEGESRDARDYLKDRGLLMLKQFHPGLLLPDKTPPDSWPRHKLVALEQAGVLQDDCTLFATNRVSWPILDRNARVIGFAAREFHGEETKYMNTRNTVLFTRQEGLFGMGQASTLDMQTCFLVEGITDVIRMVACGYVPCLGSFGARVTEGQIATLKWLGVARLLIAFDGDDPGQEGADKAFELAEKQKLPAICLPLIGAHDPEEMLADRGNLDEWDAVVKKAREHGG